jgi:mycofactocin precursor
MNNQTIDAVEGHPVDPVTSTAPPPPSCPVLVEQDLLIEDVSIDGMCGVY